MAVSVVTMQLTLSIAIIQAPTYFPVMQVLRSYCNYVGDTFRYNYIGGSFCCNYAGACFCCKYAVRSFSSIYTGESFFSKYVGDNFLLKKYTWDKIIHVGVSVPIMKVVFSAVHYVHGYFYCNYAGD